MGNKKWYEIALIAEGVTEGRILLTEEEAAIVEYASNPANWDLEWEMPYSGKLRIDTKNPIDP